MKFLGIAKSKQGHQRKDYMFSMSLNELKSLRMLFATTAANKFEKGDGKEVAKNGLDTIRNCIFIPDIKSRPKNSLII